MLIPLQPYQTTWPEDFARFENVLRECFGEDAIRVDHIGSTAVRGLIAKPVIDVQISVASLRVVAAHVEKMTVAGFTQKPENSVDRIPPWEIDKPDEWRKAYFKSGESSHPRAQVHIREAGRRNQRYALLFRDYLRANPDVRDAYGRFKLQAAELVGARSHPSGTGPYLDLKDPFFDVIMVAAEQWVRETGWTTPSSGHP